MALDGVRVDGAAGGRDRPSKARPRGRTRLPGCWVAVMLGCVDDLAASPGPSWVDDLVAEVDRAFETTGADTPGWPDPYPDGDPPDETYSRCLYPDKYQILHARAEAWVNVLADRGIASATDVAATPWIGGTRGADRVARVRRLTPGNEQGLSLLLAYTLVDGEPFGVDVGIARPGDPATGPVELDTVPDCGCDHCDSGSAYLLDVLDGWVLTVARGGVVHVRAGRTTATKTIDGWMTSSEGPRGADPDALLQPPPAAPRGAERWVGEAWL